MKTKIYTLTCRFREDRLQTIIGLLAGEISDLCLSEVGQEQQTSQRRLRSNTALKVAETRAGKTVLETWGDGKGVRSRDQIVQNLVASGFAATSISHLLSKLEKEGVLKRLQGDDVERLK